MSKSSSKPKIILKPNLFSLLSSKPYNPNQDDFLENKARITAHSPGSIACPAGKSTDFCISSQSLPISRSRLHTLNSEQLQENRYHFALDISVMPFIDTNRIQLYTEDSTVWRVYKAILWQRWTDFYPQLMYFNELFSWLLCPHCHFHPLLWRRVSESKAYGRNSSHLANQTGKILWCQNSKPSACVSHYLSTKLIYWKSLESWWIKIEIVVFACTVTTSTDAESICTWRARRWLYSKCSGLCQQQPLGYCKSLEWLF